MTTYDRDDKKTLVLGASSFVGGHLLARLDRARTIATYNRRPIPNAVHFDSVEMPLSSVVPNPKALDYAVLLLGDTQPDSCVADRNRSQAVNVDSLKKVVDTLTGWGVPIVFTSSEFVFDGRKGEYVESDPPSPILLYGRQKLEMERYIASMSTEFVILRLAKVYGETRGDGTLFTAWLPVLLQGKTIRAAQDQRFSPIFVGDVVGAILAVMEKKARGLYHAAGPMGASRFDFLRMLRSEVVKQSDARAEIAPCSIHDFDLPERRPENVTMHPDKLVAATGLILRQPLETCRRLAATLAAQS